MVEVVDTQVIYMIIGNQEGTVRGIENMQQSSTTSQNQDGCGKIVACSSQCLLVSIVWRGVISTPYFIMAQARARGKVRAKGKSALRLGPRAHIDPYSMYAVVNITIGFQCAWALLASIPVTVWT